MYKMGTFKRVFSLFLAVLLFVTAGSPGYVYASDSGETSVQTTEKVEEGVATPDEPSSEPEPTVSDEDLEGSEGVETPKNPTDILISLEWKDSEFKNGDSFAIVEDMNTSNAVTLKVSYNCEKIRSEGYKPGELIISVKGIGAVNRNGVIEAMVGADKKTDTVKNRDWSYTWNKANDTYTFTNNNEIAPNAVMSGYFEMLWNVGSRNSVHGYTQDNVSASMILPDGSSVSSNSLTFSNSTLCDVYTVDIEKGLLYSSSGVNGGLSDEDYAFVKYTLTSSVDIHSRGTSREKFTFVSKMEDGSADGIITYGTVPYSKNSDGSYTVELKNNVTAGTQYVVVAFPKEGLVGNPVYGSISVSGSFHEGDDAGNFGVNLLDKDEVTFILPPDFDFKDDGGDYHEIKNSYYEYMELTNSNFRNEVTKRGGHLVGKKMLSGTVEEFLLGISMEGYDATDGQYSFELVEDFMYITQNNGDYRQLTGKDYCFERIVITSTETINNENGVPISSGVYPVKVYAVQNDAVMVAEESTLVWEGLWMDYEQEVVLPEGTTAFVLRYENLCEGVWGDFSGCQVHDDCVCSSPCARVYTRFLLSESELDEEFKSNLVDGQLVNTIFTNLYNEEGILTNTDNSEWDYLDEDINIDLAQKDLDTYGRYLDRDRGVITFYEGEKSDYKSTTTLGNIVRNGNKFTAEMTMGASFNFKEEDTPNKFSLYTVLPSQVSLEGYRIEEDLWSIMTLSGFDLSEEVIAAHCTADVVSDYNGSGRTYLALHFDFSDVSIPQESEISAKFDVKIDRKFFDKSKSTVNVRSAILLDSDANIYEIGKSADNGKWDVDANISADIDGDGNALELLSSSYDWSSYTYVDSSQLQMTKSIKTTTTDDYVQLPTVPLAEMGRGYSYEITLRNGSSEADGILITDILETGANSEWVGTFNGVDLSEAEKLGLSGTVWYSSKTNPGALDSGDWSTSLPNNEVRSVAIDFGDSRLEAGKELNIYINMIAPTDKDLVGKITENGYSISFSMYDAVTGNPTKYDELSSNFVQATLSVAVMNIIVSKEDEVSGSRLSGATITLVNKDTGEEVATGTTNSKGQVVFKDIPSEASYFVKELNAPYGYKLTEDVGVTVNPAEKNQYVTMRDPRILGVIEVYKGNEYDTTVPVPGATYGLYTEDGLLLESKTTDTSGKVVFTDVQWGKYIVKETKSPQGFALNKTEYAVDVTRDSVASVHSINTADEQDDVRVTLVKYVSLTSGEPTSIVLPGATFELVRVLNGKETSCGLYITDSEGRIELSELPYGEYFFREYRTPIGYITAEKVDFSLNAGNKEVSLSVHNQRKFGSISISKSDNIGNFVKGVEFTLYAEDKTTVISSCVTDDYGVAVINNLEWGNYFLKETNAPEYYQLNEDWIPVTVNATSLNVTQGVVNETKKGSVRLLKTDESETVVLAGAKYTLYTASGSVVGEYVTDENGIIVVENLEWGSYFFKETEPPEGYGLSSEMIRFSVNATNAGIEQPLFATDPVDAKYVTVIKRIKAEDINFSNGNPSFVFKLFGTDINGVEHTYHNVVTFTEEYVKENTDKEGYVSQSILFTGLVAGDYSAVEMDTSRYILDGISDVVNGSVSGSSAVFDLKNHDEGSATFTNINYEQRNYSDSQNLMNIVKLRRRYTSLKVDYALDSVQAESFVDPALLTVTAGYDDGTYKVVDASEYALSISQFPNVNGDYTVTVTYEEKGITKSATFSVSIYGMKTRIVSLRVEDAYAAIGEEILHEEYEVVAVYNDGKEKVLSADEYAVSATTAPNYACTFDVEFSLNLGAIPNDGFDVSATVPISVEEKPTLVNGTQFRNVLFARWADVSFTFSTQKVPEGVSVTPVDLSLNQDNSIVGVVYSDSNYNKHVFVSTQKPGLGMYANEDSRTMFYRGTTWGGYSAVSSIGNGHLLDTSKVTDMSYMFERCSLESLEFARTWDTSNVTDMSGLFYRYTGSTDFSPISGWNTSKVTDMSGMFYEVGNSDLTHISGWDTSNVTNMDNIFNYSSIQDFSAIACWDVSSVESMRYAFSRSHIVSADPLNSWNVQSLKDAHAMFFTCWDLVSANLPSWTPKLSAISHLFRDSTSLSYVNVNGFDFSDATTLDSGFSGCTGLKELDLTGWDTSTITTSYDLFSGCSNLNTIYVSDKWSLNPSDTHSNMFTDCTNLVGCNGTAFSDYLVTDASMAVIDQGENAPGYLSSISMSYGYIEMGESREPVVKNPFTGTNIVDTQYTLVEGSGVVSLNSETGEVTGLSEGSAVIRLTATLSNGSVCSTSSTVYVGDYLCAVFSAEDCSLSIYNPDGLIDIGGTYNGKIVSEVCWFKSTDAPDWGYLASFVKSVNFVDSYSPESVEFWFKDFSFLREVDFGNLNLINATSLQGMFEGCTNLRSITIPNLNTSNVTSLNGMFAGCTALKSVDLSALDTSNVVTINGMFKGCTALQSVESFILDTSSVEDASSMFEGCSALQSVDLSMLSTGNLTNVGGMFKNCTKLRDVKLPSNLSSVTNAANMFNSCRVLPVVDISCFNGATVAAGSMFSSCSALKTIFATDDITMTGDYIFSSCNSLVGQEGTTYEYMYEECTRWGYNRVDPRYHNYESARVDGGSFYSGGYFSLVTLKYEDVILDIGQSSSAIVRTISSEGLYLDRFEVEEGVGVVSVNEETGEITGLKDGKAVMRVYFNIDRNILPKTYRNNRNVYADFTVYVGDTITAVLTESYDLIFYQGTHKFETGSKLGDSTVNSSVVFSSYVEFTEDTCPWNHLSGLKVSFAEEITPNSLNYWFNNTAIVSIDFKNLNTSKISSFSELFDGASNLRSADLSGLDTPNITDMSQMFYGCSNLTSVNLSGLDTSNVTDMSQMFYGCSNLTSVNLSGLNTSNVTDMGAMFFGCSSLTTLDLSCFDTSSLGLRLEESYDSSGVYSMFYDCSLLKTIYVSSKWNVETANEDNVFRNCTSIIGQNGTIYDSSNYGSSCAVVDTDETPGYLSSHLYARYKVVPINKTVKPTVVLGEGYTLNGFELVSGSEYAVLDKNTGELSGKKRGIVEVKLTATSTSGDVITDTFSAFIGSADFAVYSEEQGTLKFYNRTDLPVVGKEFDGAIVSSVFYNVESLRPEPTSIITNPGWDDFGSQVTYNGVPWSNLWISSVSFVDEVCPVNTDYWFANNNISAIDLTNLNTINTESMDYMFAYSGATISGFSKINSGNVKSMVGMFYGSSASIEGGLCLDTSSVTDMSYMFYRSHSEAIDVSYLNTSSVSSMKAMFGYVYCPVTGLASFNTSSVTDMSYMFYHFDGSLDGLTSFDTSSVKNMSNMFSGFELTSVNLESFDTQSVVNADYMFYESSLVTVYASPLFVLDSNVSTSEMFSYHSPLVGGLGTKAANVYGSWYSYAKIDEVNSPGFFTYVVSASYDIIGIGETGLPSLTLSDAMEVAGYRLTSGAGFVRLNTETGAVTSVLEGSAVVTVYIKVGSTTLTVPVTVYSGSFPCAVYSESDNSLSFYRTDVVLKDGDSYNGKVATKVFANIEDYSLSSVPWASYKSNITSVIFYDEIRPLTTEEWFSGMSNCYSYDLSKLNTESVTSMAKMFSNALVSDLDVSSFNTSRVTDMSYMFYNCYNLSYLDLSSFNTSKVSDMSYMFYNCHSLSYLDLSSFNTSKVTDMSYMFHYCYGLESIYVLNSWSTQSCINSVRMFDYCSNLRGGNGTTYSDSYVDSSYATIDGKNNQPGYLSYIISARYGYVVIGNAKTPTVKFPEGYSVVGYRVVSGNEYISLDAKSGEVTGVSSGDATIRVTVKKGVTSYYVDVICSVVSFEDLPRDPIVVESEHYPYPNSLNSVNYGEARFDGAMSLKVVIEYETESLSYDWIYLYDEDGQAVVKYGGRIRTTETVIVPGEYVRFVFRTDNGGNDYYGFSASVTPIYPVNFSVDNQCSDLVDVLYDEPAYLGANVVVVSKEEGFAVGSFKLNGEEVQGNSFSISNPGTAVISDVVLVPIVVIESEHNPYPDGMNSGKSYGIVEFEGASYLNITLEYQTEGESWDYVRLLDRNGFALNDTNYGGSSRTTVNLVMPGDYVDFVFRTDGSGNSYYGFRAEVSPVYPNQINLSVDNKCPDVVDISIPEKVYAGTSVIRLEPIEDGKCVLSFKLNGETIEGSSFNAPSEDATVVITDVVVAECISIVYNEDSTATVESLHNPYPGNVDGASGNVKFEGAACLVVDFYCDMEYDWEYERTPDWVDVYGSNGEVVRSKLGEYIRETFEIAGDSVKFSMYTDGSNNDYYGFSATITPLYPINLVVDNQCSDLVSVSVPEAVLGGRSVIELNSLDEGYGIVRFKLNGEWVDGDSFVAPNSDSTVVISDVVLVEMTVVESSHYPYEVFNGIYDELTFEGAVALSVTIDYELGGEDYVALLDSEGNWCGEYYGWNGRTTATTTIDGNCLKIRLYASEEYPKDRYGFKVFITPIYPIEYTVDNQCADLVSVNEPEDVLPGKTMYTLVPVDRKCSVLSFKLNGETVSGSTFTAPYEDGVGVITDVVVVQSIFVTEEDGYAVVETPHNPYPDNASNAYEEVQFDGAVFLDVEIDYETERKLVDDGKGEYWSIVDYVIVSDKSSDLWRRCGGERNSQTIRVNGDYVKFAFTSDNSNGDYYGFRATVTPVYPINLEVDNQCSDIVVVEIPEQVIGGTTVISIRSTSTNHSVTSFKLNGELIEGNSFIAPEESCTVTISDVVLAECATIESPHYPYENNMDYVTMGEVTFDGATSLTVVLDYETESTSWDWITMYNANDEVVGAEKYGGSRGTVTLTVPGNYIRVVFRSDGSACDYYGFKAVVTPNYP